MALEKTILWLSIKSIDEKIAFIQRLLFNITVMNRAMWSDDQTTDKTKVESLKWSNELSHRVWNILYELKRGKDDNSENKLVSTFAFCAKQSNELAKHLGATIKMTVERCEQQKGWCLENKVLILDIDGVLITNPPWKADKIHTDGYSEFNNSCVENLNQLLATDTFDIWLSSSRRSAKTLVEFNRIFENRGIDGHITGYLPSCPTCKNRLDEVLNFIDIYQPTDYLIIDDDKSLNALETPLKTHLILTDLSTGFSFEKLQEAIQKTTSKHR